MKSAAYAWTTAILGLLGYEGWAMATHHPLLSDAVWNYSPHFLIIPLFAGILCGHFFWQKNSTSIPPDSKGK